MVRQLLETVNLKGQGPAVPYSGQGNSTKAEVVLLVVLEIFDHGNRRLEKRAQRLGF